MRLRVIARVVVKPHFAVAEHAERLAVLYDVGHQHERRVEHAAWIALVVLASAHVNLAKDAGGTDLVVLGQLLPAEHNEDEIVERLADRFGGRVVDRLAKVQSGDFGAERRRERSKLHADSPARAPARYFLTVLFIPSLMAARARSTTSGGLA